MTETIQHSRIFKVWRDRVLHDDVWEHGKIRQWCQAVHNLSQNGQAAGHTTSLDEFEAAELCQMLDDKYPGEFDGPRVTEAQAAIGRHWLATKGRKFGCVNDHDPAEITYFTFVGGRTIQPGYRAYVTPVYVAWWADGTVLRYWATPWQDHADMEWMWGHA